MLLQSPPRFLAGLLRVVLCPEPSARLLGFRREAVRLTHVQDTAGEERADGDETISSDGRSLWVQHDRGDARSSCFAMARC